MSQTIYDIENWNATGEYEKYDIVKHDGLYYYSLQNSNQSNTPAPVSTYWGGRKYDTDLGEYKNEWIWDPTYGSNATHEPAVKEIRFGGGYRQVLKDSIYNDLLLLNLSFELRTLAEHTAQMHFLHLRAGHESFLYTPYAPYAKQKRFICKTWQSTINFHDNCSLTCRFEEVPV